MSRRSLSLPSMVWRHLWARPLTTSLNLLLLALGFAAMSSMLLVQQQAEQQFQQDLAGIDLVVGAKGSPLQLMLSGVFHLDAPTGNIPATALPQLQAHPMVAQVVPLALGDTAQGFRIVGTTADYLSLYGANLAQGQWHQQAMQAVVGATVARQMGWQVGQTFHGSHGLGDGGQTHADQAFTVAGVLAPTDTVLDRLILTPVDSVWALHDLHDPHEEHHDAPEAAHDTEDHQLTVLLVRYRSPLAAISLPRWINAQTSLQAASPALEAARLFNLLGVGVALLQGFAVIMLAVAALSVFMALSQAVQERQPDLATLRLLGASPWRIASMVLGEALALAALGVCLGLLGGHLLVHALVFVPGLPPESTTRMTGWDWAEPEYALIGLALGLAVLASAWPTWLAYRASRQQLLHAVRYP